VTLSSRQSLLFRGIYQDAGRQIAEDGNLVKH